MRPAAARPAPCHRGRYRGAAGSRHRWQARRRPWRARQRSPRHVRPSDRWCRSRRVLPWSGRRPVWLGDRLCCPASVPGVWTVPGRWSAKAAEEISGDDASQSRATECLCHSARSRRFRSVPGKSLSARVRGTARVRRTEHSAAWEAPGRMSVPDGDNKHLAMVGSGADLRLTLPDPTNIPPLENRQARVSNRLSRSQAATRSLPARRGRAGSRPSLRLPDGTPCQRCRRRPARARWVPLLK